MALAVLWMPLARQQAVDAQRWWIEHRPAAPLMLRHELVRMVGLISEHPRLGLRARGRDARRVVLPRTGYVIFYRLRPRAGRIEVVALVYGRRRLPPR